jgi:hypothetical protein
LPFDTLRNSGQGIFFKTNPRHFVTTLPPKNAKSNALVSLSLHQIFVAFFAIFRENRVAFMPIGFTVRLAHRK